VEKEKSLTKNDHALAATEHMVPRNKSARNSLQTTPSRSVQTPQTTQKTLIFFSGKSQATLAKQALARGLYAAGIPANVLSNSYLQLAFVEIAKSNPTEWGKGLSADQYLNSFLRDEKQRVQKATLEYKENNNAKGWCFVGDHATSVIREGQLNFLAVQGSKVIFLKSINTAGVTKTMEYIGNMFIKLIGEWGAEHVVGVMQDNATRGSWKIIEEMYPHIVAHTCMPHCCNLLLSDIGKITEVHDTLQELALIRRFIRSSGKIQDRYNTIVVEYGNGECSKLTLPGQTRFASQVLSIKNFLRNMKCLILTINDDVTASTVLNEKHKTYVTSEGTIPMAQIYAQVKQLCKPSVQLNDFFQKVSFLNDVFEPIMKLLRISEKDRPVMSKMYTKWKELGAELTRLKERSEPICNMFPNQSQKNVFFDKVLEKYSHRQAYSYNILQAAAHLLDPMNAGYPINNQLTISFTDYLHRQYEKEIPDSLTRHTTRVSPILSEFTQYINKEGHYSDMFSIADRETMTAAEWWDRNGSRENTFNADVDGHLRKIGLKVTSCIAGAAASERAHKEWAFIMTKVRNRLTNWKVNDLVYIRMNLQLLENAIVDDFGPENLECLLKDDPEGIRILNTSFLYDLSDDESDADDEQEEDNEQVSTTENASCSGSSPSPSPSPSPPSASPCPSRSEQLITDLLQEDDEEEQVVEVMDYKLGKNSDRSNNSQKNKFLVRFVSGRTAWICHEEAKTVQQVIDYAKIVGLASKYPDYSGNHDITDDIALPRMPSLNRSSGQTTYSTRNSNTVHLEEMG
jgi:hypothetical protein